MFLRSCRRPRAADIYFNQNKESVAEKIKEILMFMFINDSISQMLVANSDFSYPVYDAKLSWL